MTEKQRRGGGGKLTRTEVVQVRLDPKLRFAAELAAAKERRTLSSFIEWAVQQAVNYLEVTRQQEQPFTAQAVANIVWDVDEADRFVNLAVCALELLTHDERRKWKFITETRPFWVERTAPNQEGGFFLQLVPNKPVIRAGWDLICKHTDKGEPFDWEGFKVLENRLFSSGVTVDWGKPPEEDTHNRVTVDTTESTSKRNRKPRSRADGT